MSPKGEGVSRVKQRGSSNVSVAIALAVVAVIVIGLFLFRSTPEPESTTVVTVDGGPDTQSAPGQGRPRGVMAGGDAPAAGGRLGAFSGMPGQRLQREVPGDAAAPGRAVGASDPAVDPLADDPEDVPTLRRVALEDPDPERRLAAVTLLGISDDPSAIPVLAEVLSDEDEDVRMEAVLSLADFTDEAPVDALSRALSDPSADIRYEALDVLSDIETPEAKLAVQKALNDPDEDVRELAEIILEMWIDE